MFPVSLAELRCRHKTVGPIINAVRAAAAHDPATSVSGIDDQAFELQLTATLGTKTRGGR